MSNTAKKTNSKNESNLQVVKNEKENATKKTGNKVLTVEEKVQRIKELNILTERRGNLIASKNMLSEFSLGTTAESQKLVLTDTDGRVYNISNSEAIKGVIEYLKGFLDGKIKEVEEKILIESY